jgi:hypothetical protein
MPSLHKQTQHFLSNIFSIPRSSGLHQRQRPPIQHPRLASDPSASSKYLTDFLPLYAYLAAPRAAEKGQQCLFWYPDHPGRRNLGPTAGNSHLRTGRRFRAHPVLTSLHTFNTRRPRSAGRKIKNKGRCTRYLRITVLDAAPNCLTKV